MNKLEIYKKKFNVIKQKIKIFFVNFFNIEKKIFVIYCMPYNSRFSPIGYVKTEAKAKKYIEENTREYYEYKYEEL